LFPLTRLAPAYPGHWAAIGQRPCAPAVATQRAPPGVSMRSGCWRLTARAGHEAHIKEMGMRPIGLLFVALLMLAPLPARAAPTTGAWQVYTVASGLRDNLVTVIAPDSTGAVWAGTFAGGRGFPRAGQLAHLAYTGG